MDTQTTKHNSGNIQTTLTGIEAVNKANRDNIRIIGEMKTKIFESSDTSFKIITISTKDKNRITCKGNMAEIDTGIQYVFVGKWTKDNKYGFQFLVHDYYPNRDFDRNDKVDVVSYLSSRLFDGIGKVKAQKIYDKFGVDAIEVVERTPEKLVCISGITERTVNTIKESFARNVQFRNLTMLLRTKGVSDTMIDKIYKEYGQNSLNVINETPYRLAYEIDGFGFKRADMVALSYDEKLFYSEQRIQAGIYFALKTSCERTGNLYLDLQTLVDGTQELLSNSQYSGYISKKEIEDALTHLCQDKKVILRDSQFYLSKYYYNERESVLALYKLISSNNKYNFTIEEIKKELEKVENENPFEYAPSQRKAIINSLSNSISIITGGPGTGKSTIINAIIKIFSKLAGPTAIIAPAAPTGRAAKRIKEVTGCESYTIHRMLAYEGFGGKFMYNKNNPLPYDLIVIDESSMIDISLFRHLITAISPEKTKVIFVGDINQLPSVGPGNVLRDLITSEMIKTTKLVDIFRQSNTSKIVINSDYINKGERKMERGDDFKLIKVSPDADEQSILQKMLDEYKEATNEFDDIQILTPYRTRKHIVSSETLNDKLSPLVNKNYQNEIAFKKGETIFHKNDKVMQMKNNYNKNVFNGEIGTITRIFKEDGKKYAVVTFEDGKKVEYSNVDELELAYSSTIHKSQGSEYQCVIIPVINSNIFFLDKSLLYTAVTRAKKKCILIFQQKALGICIGKEQSIKRKTNMAIDIRKCVNRNGELHDYAHFNQSDLHDLVHDNVPDIV